MKILAIDTAAHLCSACIYDTQEHSALASISEDIGRGHAERLMDVIGEVLTAAKCDYSHLDKIVSTTGPGSFTGIRVGLATARGIATGLSIPIIGVNTLEALQAEGRKMHTGPLVTLLDAKRGELFYLMADSTQTPFEPEIASVEKVADLLSDLSKEHADLAICGNGAESVQELLEKPLAVIHTLSAAPIEEVAKIGATMAVTAKRPEPLYLRAADAKPQTGFALPRL